MYNLYTMDVRVNLMMPEFLYNESMKLVKKGLYANYSELVRQAVRENILFNGISNEERNLLELVRAGHRNGHFLNEKEAAKHGIKV
jgi:Arc/MetJ-type ribon-helix-helix transcriptional regulator